ncbi:leucine-rich repeat-containing protein 56 [Ischnura elegans]|uniref:leucine-rich repeat-containing protein 56 n=1 Tax=Ischnura elegans TaxID=197161 RepID=UPI001ED8A212|nr:leucine-rich repeat-containing protein 56 [Ischnura elegans]
MAPHASFSSHPRGQRPPSPPENTAMGSVPEGASGIVARSHQMLNPSPLLPTSEWLPMELTMPDYLRNVTGVDDLTQLRHLKIRVITREVSIQRISLFAPNLLQLDLQGSCLGSLRDLGCGLVCLEVLSVSRCGLPTLDGTFGFPALKDLDASYNRIRDVAPCSAIENLRFLDLKGNPISDVERLGFLSVCPKLEELDLLECPVTREHNYRLKTLKMLPSLLILDAFPAADPEPSTSLNGGNKYGEDGEKDSLFSSAEPEWPGGSEGSSVRERLPPSRPGAAVGGGTKVRRAASAVARLQSNGGRTTTPLPECATGARKKRPQTARPWRQPAGGEDFDGGDPSSFALPEEAPSSLTSGVTLCGNIAAALLTNRMLARRNQKRREAVPEAGATVAGPRGARRRSPQMTVVQPVDHRNDILEASRRWREAYASFRERNREKWAREDEEEDEEEMDENNEKV